VPWPCWRRTSDPIAVLPTPPRRTWTRKPHWLASFLHYFASGELIRDWNGPESPRPAPLRWASTPSRRTEPSNSTVRFKKRPDKRDILPYARCRSLAGGQRDLLLSESLSRSVAGRCPGASGHSHAFLCDTTVTSDLSCLSRRSLHGERELGFRS
jgi:hypothetical protein